MGLLTTYLIPLFIHIAQGFDISPMIIFSLFGLLFALPILTLKETLHKEDQQYI